MERLFGLEYAKTDRKVLNNQIKQQNQNFIKHEKKSVLLFDWVYLLYPFILSYLNNLFIKILYCIKKINKEDGLMFS
jgi:hypothetical protein